MSKFKEGQALGSASTNLLLDYYLINEIDNNLPRGYSRRVVNNLATHRVTLSPATIYSRVKKIISGDTIIRPSADVNGSPSARDGKDQGYAGFWSLVDIAIPDRNQRYYIGLAANQLDVVRSHISYSSITVCEKLSERADNLCHLAGLAERFRPGPRVDIVVGDIFKQIGKEENKYNIFDLDLMCQLPEEKKINKWVKKIYRASYPGKVVIGITTGIGRTGNTRERYKFRADYLQRALESVGFQDVGCSRFAYRDRRIPMRSERFILTKK